ncbi:MAG: hypothetical protein Q9M28_04485, partial [Mariprofundaceae bacterium]|nr:hypothetical protein [Mariprofundaceae bacterium]
IQMQKDVDLVNQYIKDGLLAIDEDLNTIFDKRNDTTYTSLEERNHGPKKTNVPLENTTTSEQNTITHEYSQIEAIEIDLSKP